MVSGFVMVPPTEEKRKPKMAKSKSSSGKSASKQKIQAGPSGKMHKFTPVKPQKPGVTHNTNSGGGGYAKK